MSPPTNVLTPSINLERSELRYIFYSHDQDKIIADFEQLGFEKLIYEDSPTTITIYFGSQMGLKPGFSIKARFYTDQRIQNIWDIHASTEFSLLEIKSSITKEEALMRGGSIEENELPMGLIEAESINHPKDIVFRIQRASEDGVLRDSTYKVKNRLIRQDIEDFTAGKSILTLAEIVQILTQESDLDSLLSPDLLRLLNEEIRPSHKNSLVPMILTQYDRIHLVPKNESLKDLIRVTIDPGVDYYDLLMDAATFVSDPEARAEFLSRENFGRIEFKIDPINLGKQPDLEEQISNILRVYGSIAFLSKKWTGVTLVSERYIEKQAFWREPIERQLSGFFPVDPSWFTYGSITHELLPIVKKSDSFSIYHPQNPRVLVKNVNYVTGYLGVPIPSLVVIVEGPKITYELPPRSYPVTLVEGSPEFYIVEEFDQPVRSTVISSKNDLDKILHSSIEIEGDTFFRSYGFLVKANSSNRIYKLTIERKIDVKGKVPKSKVYCKMRYIGTENQLYKKNKQAIFNELQKFFTEFAPKMAMALNSSE